MDKEMTLGDVRQQLREALTPKYGEREAAAMARAILTHLKGWDLPTLLANEQRDAGDYVKGMGFDEIRVADEDTAFPDFSTGAVRGLDRWVLGCVRRGEEPAALLAECAEDWKNCALIGTDFSCGVVPVDAELRAWREANGRMNNYLAGKAGRMVRMFCGLPQELK